MITISEEFFKNLVDTGIHQVGDFNAIAKLTKERKLNFGRGYSVYHINRAVAWQRLSKYDLVEVIIEYYEQKQKNVKAIQDRANHLISLLETSENQI